MNKGEYKIALIQSLTDVANKHGVDTDANMPDFVIGIYLYESLQTLMKANKANSEYFLLSAQEDEEGIIP